MAEDYLKNADTILEGMQVDEDKEKWLKICRALKEAGKTDCFSLPAGREDYWQGQVGGVARAWMI